MVAKVVVIEVSFLFGKNKLEKGRIDLGQISLFWVSSLDDEFAVVVRNIVL